MENLPENQTFRWLENASRAKNSMIVRKTERLLELPHLSRLPNGSSRDELCEDHYIMLEDQSELLNDDNDDIDDIDRYRERSLETWSPALWTVSRRGGWDGSSDLITSCSVK